MTTRGEKMLEQKRTRAQVKSENGTRRKAKEPAVEEKIQILARRYMLKLSELERIASNPLRTMKERLKAVFDINKKKQELGEEITKTEAELMRLQEETASRIEYLKKLMVGQDPYKIRKMLNVDNSEEKSTQVLLEELNKTRDQCQFVLERLTSSLDPEIRNKAFDLIQDNLVAVKLIRLGSPYRDIRLRAAKILAKHKDNKYYVKAQQKHYKEIIPLPEILTR